MGGCPEVRTSSINPRILCDVAFTTLYSSYTGSRRIARSNRIANGDNRRFATRLDLIRFDSIIDLPIVIDTTTKNNDNACHLRSAQSPIKQLTFVSDLHSSAVLIVSPTCGWPSSADRRRTERVLLRLTCLPVSSAVGTGPVNIGDDACIRLRTTHKR